MHQSVFDLQSWHMLDFTNLSPSEILNRSIASSTAIFSRLLLTSIFVTNELLNLFAVHMLHHIISLPLLEAEAEALICAAVNKTEPTLTCPHATNSRE